MKWRFLRFFLSVLLLTGVSSMKAATVGAWSKVCIAPNYITGVPQPVPDMNVNNPAMNFWGFTSRQPGGTWLIQFNLAQIRTTNPGVLIFLFYHECSHAMYNTDSEAVADCKGLEAMRQDVGVTAQLIADLKAVYASKGRPFPSGTCAN
jgi:hypothetical protein